MTRKGTFCSFLSFFYFFPSASGNGDATARVSFSLFSGGLRGNLEHGDILLTMIMHETDRTALSH